MSYRVDAHLRSDAIAYLAILFLLVFGTAPALASDPPWGYHDNWSEYCFFTQTGEVTGLTVLQTCPPLHAEGQRPGADRQGRADRSADDPHQHPLERGMD